MRTHLKPAAASIFISPGRGSVKWILTPIPVGKGAVNGGSDWAATRSPSTIPIQAARSTERTEPIRISMRRSLTSSQADAFTPLAEVALEAVDPIGIGARI